LIGSLIQFFSPVIYSGDDEGLKVIFSLFPFVLLAKGLSDLAGATDTPLKAGIRMSQITTNESSYPLSQIYYFMIIDMAIYTALFFILDNVLYMSRPIYFFLTPSYWTGNVKKSNHKTQKHDKFEIDTNDVDPDVLVRSCIGLATVLSYPLDSLHNVCRTRRLKYEMAQRLKKLLLFLKD
jgi:hypothetical protein